MVQHLHELSPRFSPMFVCWSGDMSAVVHLLQSRQDGISRSGVISCSHNFQYFRCDRYTRCFLPFGSLLEAVLSSISLRYQSQFSFFKLKLVRLGIGIIVKSTCKQMRIGRWSKPRFVFVCQLVEVIKRG